MIRKEAIIYVNKNQWGMSIGKKTVVIVIYIDLLNPITFIHNIRQLRLITKCTHNYDILKSLT